MKANMKIRIASLFISLFLVLCMSTARPVNALSDGGAIVPDENSPWIADSEYVSRINQMAQEFYESIQNEISNGTRETYVHSRYLPIPIYYQETAYYCGPACLQMIIKYITNWYYTQSSLFVPYLGVPTNGMHVNDMVAKLNYYCGGYSLININNVDMYTAVKNSILNNRPVIYVAKTSMLPGHGGAAGGHYVAGYGYYTKATVPGRSEGLVTEDSPPVVSAGISDHRAFLYRSVSYVDPLQGVDTLDGNPDGCIHVTYDYMWSCVNAFGGWVMVH